MSDDELVQELIEAMLKPVGEPCCELAEQGMLHQHWPRRPATRHAMECQSCGNEFDPIQTRWLCPHCKFKANCCEGEPL